MAIRLLGPLVVGDGLARLGSRDRIVVSALAMRPGEVLSAEQLADAVWGDDPPASWHKNLQSCMVRLRKLVGPDAIETSVHGYRLALDPGEVDGHEFSRLVARARELEALNEPERAAYTLQQALDLWRGRPLAELEEWSPGLVEAQRLQELHLEAEELWLDTRLRAGGHREVLAVAEAMVTSAPLRERRWALLALAQYQSGRQTEALGTLRRVRTMLVQEMGLDPAPELDLLERAILRQDPALLVEATRTHLSDACPYPGLTPYDVEDAEGFFGRDTDIAACLERLDQEGVLVVVGPSGCGKSSLVRAGVTAALRRAGARTVVINPGPHPLEALGAVAQGRPPDVLVIDQAEEVFSLCHDAAEREAFLAAVGRHAEAGRLVLAHRADRMGDISAHPVLARLAERGLYVLAAMPADDLRAAVEGPARQAGLILEPGLVDLLVREIEGESGALPLLSHALRETWQRREGRTLTVSGYRESGGIRGAVAQSAEDLYGGIDPSRRPALRDLLLRLVLPNSEGEPVRARVPRRLLVTDSVQDELIDLLVRSRLLTSDDKAVELAHEALARAWPRLRGWLDDDVEGQRILHHLSSAADAWDSLGRPTSELYRGLRLVQATEWSTHPHPELTITERDFLAESQHLAQVKKQDAAARARTQVRLIRRLRGALAGAAVLLVAALVAGGLAVRQSDQAERNAATARAAETAAVAARAGARALSIDDIDTSLLLAASGARMDRSPATRANLLAALAQRPQLVGSTFVDGPGINGIEVSPDGRIVAAYDVRGRVQTFDARTWKVLATFDPGDNRVSRERVAPLSFSPDGETLAVGMPLMAPNPVRLLDPDTLRTTVSRLPGLSVAGSGIIDRTLDLDFDASGRMLAGTFHRLRILPESGSWEVFATSVKVWDVADPLHPRLVMERELEGRTLVRRDRDVVALSPDGSTVFTSRPLRAFEVRTGRRLYATSHRAYVMDLSPDGRTLAIDDGPDVLVIDASTGRVRRTLYGHHDDLVSVAFSTEGGLLATSGADGIGMVWATGTGELRERLSLGETNVRGLAFSSDDQTLYTAGYDREIHRWDLRGRSLYVSQLVEPREFGFGWAQQAPGGAAVVHVVVERRSRLLDTSTGELSGVGPKGGIEEGAWNARGDEYVAAAGGLVQIWSPEGELLRDNRGEELAPIHDIGYSGDGTRLFVSLESGSVMMLDARTLQPVGRTIDIEAACCLAGTPDDHTAFAMLGPTPRRELSTFEFNFPVRAWALLDLDQGSVVARGEFEGVAYGSALSPDGTRVAIGTIDGEVMIIDLDSGDLLRNPVVAHNRECCSLAWSPDGSTVVGSANDGSISLWSGTSGELLGLIAIPEVVPSAVAFLPDGHTVSIATYTDSVYHWDTGIEQALVYACSLAGRNLTQEEWRGYFGERPYVAACPT